MPLRNVSRYASLLACVVTLAGCGGSDTRPEATITGQVLLDGSPLTAGSIRFTSTKTGESAYANLDGSGRYEVTFPEADVGSEYDVTVGAAIEEELDATAIAENPPEKVRSRIPRKYSDRTTSGLKTTIATEGENQFDVELRSR